MKTASGTGASSGRQRIALAITAKDVDGKPVSAEVALGLFDESVKYIQQ